MPLSQGALQAVLSSATAKVFLQCLTIEHPDITTLFLVNNTEDIDRSGQTFQRFPFGVTASTQSEGKPPSISINADAVDRRIIIALRNLAGKRQRAIITYEVILSNTPDEVEFGPVSFELEGVSGGSSTSIVIKASILKGALDDAFPKDQFTPSNVDG